MSTDLAELFEKQKQLQLISYGYDVRDLRGDERADYVMWNAFALTDEIHEAMQEIGWKPWATSRHLNEERFMDEMVDAFHFFMNMLLATNPEMSSAELAEEFAQRYKVKNEKNAQRQLDGYDGVAGKCRWCYRELSLNEDRFCSYDHQYNFQLREEQSESLQG